MTGLLLLWLGIWYRQGIDVRLTFCHKISQFFCRAFEPDLKRKGLDDDDAAAAGDDDNYCLL